MVQGGISLLSMIASDAEDPQTLRMVAGAIVNLCGNDLCGNGTAFSFVSLLSLINFRFLHYKGFITFPLVIKGRNSSVDN